LLQLTAAVPTVHDCGVGYCEQKLDPALPAALAAEVEEAART
jgi:hypothetical protein